MKQASSDTKTFFLLLVISWIGVFWAGDSAAITETLSSSPSRTPVSRLIATTTPQDLIVDLNASGYSVKSFQVQLYNVIISSGGGGVDGVNENNEVSISGSYSSSGTKQTVAKLQLLSNDAVTSASRYFVKVYYEPYVSSASGLKTQLVEEDGTVLEEQDCTDATDSVIQSPAFQIASTEGSTEITTHYFKAGGAGTCSLIFKKAELYKYAVQVQ